MKSLIYACLIGSTSMTYASESAGQGANVNVPGSNHETSSILQQNNTISGTVLDQAGEPIIGANVIIKGTTTGTITDGDGNFSLKGVEKGQTLVVSYIGYINAEVKLSGQKTLSITLQEDTELLDELVVIGYGTQNKQAVTGAVVQADLETYKDVVTNNILETVKGTVPGLNIGATNKAGQEAGMMIRGQNSTSGNKPLIVVDGAIYDGSLADIPSNDIETFTVLKDASAAAVYGSRSSNGVVLIQTKRGRSVGQKPDFNVNFSYGITNELNRVDVFQGEEYLQRILDIRTTQGIEADRNNIQNYMTAVQSENYMATPDHRPIENDPYDMFRQNAYNMKANLSMANRTEHSSYYISASFTNQKGVMIGDEYKNLTGRINLENDIASWLTVGLKANYSFRDNSGTPIPMDNVLNIGPYDNVYDEKGNLVQYPNGDTGLNNPFYGMNTKDLDHNNTLGAILNAKVTVPWVKGLSYEAIFANDLRWAQHNFFQDKLQHQGMRRNGIGERRSSNNYHMLIDNLIKYNNTFNEKHNVDITLLYSHERRTWDHMVSHGEDFDNMTLQDNKLQDAKVHTVNSGAGKSGAIGWMARGTYSFDNRYSLTGTVRRDGCSSFSINKKWGTFASTGLNWKISNESFMENVNFVDYLALRASYGSNGNQSISPYSTLAKVGTGKFVFAGDKNYRLTQSVNSLALSDLGWETTTGLNFGLDFSVLGERLSGNIDAYVTHTTNLLFDLTLPALSGKTSIKSNVGKIKNRGFELSLHSLNIKNKDFSWTSDFAFSLNRNKVATIYGEDNDGDGIEDDLLSSNIFIGRSLGTIYNTKVIGMWQQEDVDNGTIMKSCRPGEYKIEDVDGNGKIDKNDRQFLGCSKENFRWSLTNTLRYKDLSLMIYINSMWGGNGYFLSQNLDPSLEYATDRTDLNRPKYDYWMPDHPDAKYPRLDYNTKGRYKQRKYYDRSFIKLQKLALTYDVSRYVQRIGMNNMKISVSADNLLTFAPHWKNGMDPETNSGFGLYDHPSMRTYQFNLVFNF